MTMDKNTVFKIARLARLRITDEEADIFAGKLGHIIGWVEQLEEVETEGIKPLANVVDIPPRMRADAVNDGGIQKDILANAPEEQQGYFVVPKIVE